MILNENSSPLRELEGLPSHNKRKFNALHSRDSVVNLSFIYSTHSLSESSPLFRRIIGATTRILGEQRQRILFVLLRSRCRTNDAMKRDHKGIITGFRRMFPVMTEPLSFCISDRATIPVLCSPELPQVLSHLRQDGH